MQWASMTRSTNQLCLTSIFDLCFAESSIGGFSAAVLLTILGLADESNASLERGFVIYCFVSVPPLAILVWQVDLDVQYFPAQENLCALPFQNFMTRALDSLLDQSAPYQQYDDTGTAVSYFTCAITSV